MLLFFSLLAAVCFRYSSAHLMFRCRICAGSWAFYFGGPFYRNHMLYTLLSKRSLNKGAGSLHLAKRDLGNSSFIEFTLNFLLWSIPLMWQSRRLHLMAQRTKIIDHANSIVLHFTFTLCKSHYVTSYRTFTIQEQAEHRILVWSVFHALLMKLLLSLYESIVKVTQLTQVITHKP